MPKRNKEHGGSDDSIKDEEGLSSEEHCLMPLVHGIHVDDSIGLDGIGDDEVIDSILDSQETVENGDVQMLELVSLVPSLMGFDSSNIGVVGEHIRVDGISLLSTSSDVGEGMMAQKVLMQPGIERCSIDKIVNSTHQSPDKRRFSCGCVTSFMDWHEADQSATNSHQSSTDH